ncbi:MAG: isocitrate/isopropylmalate family dehydrogenase, partial [SAR324 cluster bacterium]|nr:isocitrate/isopropylmalate family dehydrogenase [SAR324 cluster bacterium]
MITKKILVTPGDGIGPEVTKQAIHVLKTVAPRFELQLELSEKPVGGVAYDLTGT